MIPSSDPGATTVSLQIKGCLYWGEELSNTVKPWECWGLQREQPTGPPRHNNGVCPCPHQGWTLCLVSLDSGTRVTPCLLETHILFRKKKVQTSITAFPFPTSNLCVSCSSCLGRFPLISSYTLQTKLSKSPNLSFRVQPRSKNNNVQGMSSLRVYKSLSHA